jgi:hypothetical protein
MKQYLNNNASYYLKKAIHRYSGLCVARGRWASSQLPDCFCFEQNVLRIILFAVAIRPD